MPALTKSQKKAYNYLSAEEQRQKGTAYVYTSFPQFMLNCCGCFVELKTSSPKNARVFIDDHRGHKAFSFEVNVRPDAVVYDREKTLAQLVDLGKQIVKTHAENGIIVKNTRQTYLFIKNGGDIEGGLRRLLAVYKEADLTDQIWLNAILDQDKKFMHFINQSLQEK